MFLAPIVMPIVVLSIGTSSGADFWADIFTYYLPILAYGFLVGRSAAGDRVQRLGLQLLFIVVATITAWAMGEKNLSESGISMGLFAALMTSGCLLGTRFKQVVKTNLKQDVPDKPKAEEIWWKQMIQVYASIGIPLAVIIAVKMSGVWLTGLAQAKLYNHKPAPPTVFSTVDDTPWTFADQRGKVLLVEYWSTRCGPCLASFPHLKELHQRYSDRPDFEMVSVACNSNDQRSAAVFERYEGSWPLLFRRGDAQAEDFHPNYVPAAYVIDQHGTVVASSVSLSNAQKIIEGLLGDAVAKQP